MLKYLCSEERFLFSGVHPNKVRLACYLAHRPTQSSQSVMFSEERFLFSGVHLNKVRPARYLSLTHSVIMPTVNSWSHVFVF